MTGNNVTSVLPIRQHPRMSPDEILARRAETAEVTMAEGFDNDEPKGAGFGPTVERVRTPDLTSPQSRLVTVPQLLQPKLMSPNEILARRAEFAEVAMAEGFDNDEPVNRFSFGPLIPSERISMKF